MRRTIDPAACGFEAALVRGMSGHPLRPNMSYRSRRSGKDPDERDLEAATANGKPGSFLLNLERRGELRRTTRGTEALDRTFVQADIDAIASQRNVLTLRCSLLEQTRSHTTLASSTQLLTAESIYGIVFRP